MKRNRFISFLALLSLFCMLFLPTGKAQTGTTFTADATMDTYIDFGRGLDIEALDTLKDGDQLTITFWMRWLDKNNADVDNWANIFTLSDSSGSGDNGVFWMQHKNDNSKLEFAIHSTGRNYIQSSTTVQDSVWYHVAAVYNGSLFSNNMRLYINGSQESSRNKTGNLRATPNKSKLTAGMWSNPGNDYREFHGELDEISLWNIALSEDQIDPLMVNHEAITGTGYDTAGLLGFWHFEGSNALDATPNDIDGDIKGADPFGTLPVKLTDIAAIARDEYTELIWTTEIEVDNNYFEVQRSFDGEQWQALGEVVGAGNSNVPLDYSFKDNHPLGGKSFYRLQQVDYDGESEYSPWVEVERAYDFGSIPLDARMHRGGHGMVLTLISEMDRRVSYHVLNINGELCLSDEVSLFAKDPLMLEHISCSLPHGLFIIVVEGYGVSWTDKFLN